MSRWRKVDVRIWGDERVRKLSKPRPSGLVCWIYLLTARESTSLPGAIPAGPAALAESLGWSRRAFLSKFAELEALGMARADWTVGLIWLPKALAHNPPQSLNVVVAWANAWKELPDCQLKVEILENVKAFLQGMRQDKTHVFRHAFEKAIRPEAEAEAEQKQKEELSGEVPNSSVAPNGAQPVAAAPAARARRKAAKQESNPRHAPLKEKLIAEFERLRGAKYGFFRKDATAITALLALNEPEEEILKRWRRALGAKGYLRANTIAKFTHDWNCYSELQPGHQDWKGDERQDD